MSPCGAVPGATDLLLSVAGYYHKSGECQGIYTWGWSVDFWLNKRLYLSQKMTIIMFFLNRQQ